MSDATARTTVDISQIAEIANVGRSAVGNWRKRRSDFPVADSSGRFGLIEVERWLIENGKIDSRVPTEFHLWSLIDSLRNFGLQADQITRLLVSMLVYLEACDMSPRPRGQLATAVTVDDNDHWRCLSQVPADEVAKELRRAARNIEEANPALEGLLVNGLSVATSLPDDQLVSLIENFQACTDEASPRISLFNRVVSRAGKLDLFRGEHSTPADIAELMVQLVRQDARKVCDLACGEGGLLSSAALRIQPRDSNPIELVGFEIDEDALRFARSRFFLEGVATELRLEDALRVPLEDLPNADVVLLDPPLARRNWGDADLYLDERWKFGAPPRSNADLAWIQLAVQCLSESGVAVVGASPGTAYRGNREAEIRHSMLENGVVKAVIQLPGRLRTETSVPVYLWILQPPRADVDSVILIDASTLGTPSRSRSELSSEDIDRIARALQACEVGRHEDPEIAWVVSTTEIIANDAILEPKMYQPIPEVDREGIRSRSQELKAKLLDAAGDGADAIKQLLAPREETGGTASMSARALREVAEIQRGTKTAESDNADDGPLLIGVPEVSGRGVSSPRFVWKEESSAPLLEVQESDVVLALRGNPGSSILATGNYEGAAIDQGCALIRPNGDEVTGPWVYLWTQSRQFLNQVSRSTTGVTLPTLSIRAVSDLTIPIPTAEQLDEAEQILGRFNEALERVAELQSDLTELRKLEVDLLISQEGGTK